MVIKKLSPVLKHLYREVQRQEIVLCSDLYVRNGWFNTVLLYGDNGRNFDLEVVYFNVDFGTIPTATETEVLIVM